MFTDEIPVNVIRLAIQQGQDPADVAQQVVEVSRAVLEQVPPAADLEHLGYES